MAEETEKASPLVEEARALMKAEDYEAAIPILQELADMGDADGQNLLANCYADGLGVKENDEEAVKYYQPATDQGHIPAGCRSGAYPGCI
jgi:hypothetical protein